MMNPQFHRLVVIEGEHPGLYRVVGSVREAASVFCGAGPRRSDGNATPSPFRSVAPAWKARRRCTPPGGRS